MPNTGKLIYANLKRIYVDTGLPTPAATKANSPSDPDYIEPVIDLVACPVPIPPVPDQNKISVQFINNTDQVVVLNLVTVRAESIYDPALAYTAPSVLSLFPHTSNTAIIKDQLDDLTRVKFTIGNLSFNQNVILSIEYEKYSEGSPSIEDSFSVGKNDNVDKSVTTPTESGSNTNLLTIVFDNL